MQSRLLLKINVETYIKSSQTKCLKNEVRASMKTTAVAKRNDLSTIEVKMLQNDGDQEA